MLHQCFWIFIPHFRSSLEMFIPLFHLGHRNARSGAWPYLQERPQHRSPRGSPPLLTRHAWPAKQLSPQRRSWVTNVALALEMAILGLMSILALICCSTFQNKINLYTFICSSLLWHLSIWVYDTLVRDFIPVWNPLAGKWFAIGKKQRNNATLRLAPSTATQLAWQLLKLWNHTSDQWLPICLADSTWYNNENQRYNVITCTITQLADARGWQVYNMITDDGKWWNYKWEELE